MRIKNKKIRKLRLYRDKLLIAVTNLQGENRHMRHTMDEARRCIYTEETLRAVALLSNEDEDHTLKNFVIANEAAKELALVYRFLVVERKFTEDVQVAATNRDYLRVAALCADHQAEAAAHDKMLTRWSKDHGFTRTLREATKDEDII